MHGGAGIRALREKERDEIISKYIMDNVGGIGGVGGVHLCIKALQAEFPNNSKGLNFSFNCILNR